MHHAKMAANMAKKFAFEQVGRFCLRTVEDNFFMGVITSRDLECSLFQEMTITKLNVSQLPFEAINNYLCVGWVSEGCGGSCEALQVVPVHPHLLHLWASGEDDGDDDDGDDGDDDDGDDIGDDQNFDEELDHECFNKIKGIMVAIIVVLLWRASFDPGLKIVMMLNKIWSRTWTRWGWMTIMVMMHYMILNTPI